MKINRKRRIDKFLRGVHLRERIATFYGNVDVQQWSTVDLTFEKDPAILKGINDSRNVWRASRSSD